jgi:hypothetical protein
MYQYFPSSIRKILHSYGIKRSMLRRRHAKIRLAEQEIGKLEREIDLLRGEIERIELEMRPIEIDISKELNHEWLSISLKWSGTPRRLTATVPWGYGKRTSSTDWMPTAMKSQDYAGFNLRSVQKYNKRFDIVVSKKLFPKLYQRIAAEDGDRDTLIQIVQNPRLRTYITERFLDDYLFRDKVIMSRK